ncbi:MAG: hypothetical protein L6265_05565 [Thermoplasmatales archaeon]|nr:hypothetical protein [Thermoplasmatales archaeon]
MKDSLPTYEKYSPRRWVVLYLIVFSIVSLVLLGAGFLGIFILGEGMVETVVGIIITIVLIDLAGFIGFKKWGNRDSDLTYCISKYKNRCKKSI